METNRKQMLEKNILLPEDIRWKFVSSMAFSTHHHAKFINEEFGLEKEEIAKKNIHDEFCKPKRYYFITGQEKEYTNLEDLCNDWNEIKNYDDPHSEIKWVKVILKKVIKEESK